MTYAIPAWTASGLLPPVDPQNPVSAFRSPYVVALDEFVIRFATSVPRLKIVQGFLDFRAALHRSGCVHGFQWLDGSFLENVELIEQRPPKDIDLVCFLHAAGPSPQQQPGDEDVFDHAAAKKRFLVDAYLIELDTLTVAELVSWSTYWYGMWSHRRNSVWKGYVQVDLTPDKDRAAQLVLDQLASALNAGATP